MFFLEQITCDHFGKNDVTRVLKIVNNKKCISTMVG